MTIEVVPYHFALVNSAAWSIIECITLLKKKIQIKQEK